MIDWLDITRGEAPLVVAFPHTGTALPDDLAPGFTSEWLARKDTDWWVDGLYAFVRDRGATTVRTGISRAIIDVNRDPTGASLYPGQTTTGLCPTETFDGEPLYRDGRRPDAAEIDRRRTAYFAPYHAALQAELERLRAAHGRVVLYDAHSIRSRIPRLFDADLPQFCIGTNGGQSCAASLSESVAAACAQSRLGHVVDGRFRGGWTTRHYGQPERGIHAIQMELAQRGYMDEPAVPTPRNWPQPAHSAPAIRPTLDAVIDACLAFATGANT